MFHIERVLFSVKETSGLHVLGQSETAVLCVSTPGET